MTQSGDLPTPHFKDPPVVETVLGVQFAPLKKMRITHYGLLSEHLREVFSAPHERLTKISEQPPLEPVIEGLKSTSQRVRVPSWTISSAPPFPRCWYASENEEVLVQVQPDRFLFNWRRPGPPGQYPRYSTNLERFVRAYNKFLDFSNKESLGPVQPNQCEVTYVNHIPLLEGLGAAATLDSVLMGWGTATSDHWLKAPESGESTVTYLLPEKRGRLHLRANPVVLRDTGDEIIRLALTARGAPATPDTAGIRAWLDLGHEWVVRGFKSATTPEMHQRWGLIS